MYTEDSNSRQGVKSIPRETNKVLREFRRGRWCQTRREKLGGGVWEGFGWRQHCASLKF